MIFATDRIFSLTTEDGAFFARSLLMTMNATIAAIATYRYRLSRNSAATVCRAVLPDRTKELEMLHHSERMDQMISGTVSQHGE